MLILLTLNKVLKIPAKAVMANVYYPETLRARADVVWVDSGGFQALKRGEMLPLFYILNMYSTVEADAYLSPDVPPLPTDPPELAEKKMRWSYLRYVEASKYMEVVPVVHVYRDISMTWRYAKMYLDNNPPKLAVGGAVPYIFNRRGAKGGAKLVYSFLEELRATYKGWMHVLGAGSPTVAKRLAAIGVDSADTAAWAVKAAYGKILLPGGPERHVTDRDTDFGGMLATEEELAQLYDFLKRTGFPRLPDYFDFIRRLRADYNYRALVNAWVIQHLAFSPP